MISSSLRLKFDMTQLVAYELVLESIQSQEPRRQGNEPVWVQFKAFATSQQADEVLPGGQLLSSIVHDLSHAMLSSDFETELIGMQMLIVSRRNAGEIWIEENGVYVIKECPIGILQH